MNLDSLKQRIVNHSFEYYSTLALLTIVLGCFSYGLLPILGIDWAKNTFSIELILTGVGFIIAVTCYWFFIDYCRQKPFALLIMLALLIPFRLFIMRLITAHGGNFLILLLPNLVLVPPIFITAVPYLRLLWQKLPYLKYFTFLLGLTILYYLFYNHNVYDNTSSQTLGFRSLFALCFNYIVILLTGAVMYRYPDPKRFFHLFNNLIIMLGLVFSILPILFYPMDIMVQMVESVKRMNFVFDFPAQYSFYIGFITVYLLGLFFYEETLPEKSRLRQSLILSTVILGFLALLTAFTKNAIFSVMACGTLIVILNLVTSKQYVKLATLAISIPLLTLVGVYTLQSVTGMDVSNIVDQRLQNISSIDWRHHVWDYLLSDITPISSLIGHGLSAASDQMRIHEGFNVLQSTNELKQVLYVHNDYIAQFYDFGLPGLAVFVSLFIILMRTGFQMIKSAFPISQSALKITIIGLIASYLIFCSTDNAFVSVENPIWMLLTVLYVLNDRIYGSEYR